MSVRIDPLLPWVGGKRLLSKQIVPIFIRLAEVLQGLRGRFILSINDCTEARNLFGRWKMLQASLNWSVGGQPTAAKEIIITN